MRSNYLKTLKTAVLAVTVLLLGASVCFAQQQVNLTAGSSSITLPDGSTVPMWGYSCGALVGGSLATCNKLHTTTDWSPIVITIPTNATGGLRINLTNSLTVASGINPDLADDRRSPGRRRWNSGRIHACSRSLGRTGAATWPCIGSGGRPQASHRLRHRASDRSARKWR